MWTFTWHHRCFDSKFYSGTKVLCLRTEIYESIQLYIVKGITKIFNSHFQIPFLNSHVSPSFWARELGEVSFNSKFLTDYLNGCNSILATWFLFSEKYTYISWNLLIVLCEEMLRNFRRRCHVFRWFKWKDYYKLREIYLLSVHWAANMLHAIYLRNMFHAICFVGVRLA